MPKKKYVPLYDVVIYDADDNIMSHDKLPLSDAQQLLIKFVTLHLEVGFSYMRTIRIIHHSHIMYEFTDCRLKCLKDYSL